MYRFIIQTGENNELLFDFQLALLQGIEVQKFLYQQQYDVLFVKDLKNHSLKESIKDIPIGSMEFINNFIDKFEKISSSEIKPIYIPKELQLEKFLHRSLNEQVGHSFSFNKYMFVKSLESYKDYVDVTKEVSFNKEKRIAISDCLDIKSEYRCFIYQGQLISMNHYAGDFFSLPQKEVINDMIRSYRTAPNAYTLDVAVLENNHTAIIEVHPFVSCGLYGAQLNNYMIPMIIQGYYNYCNK